MNKDVLCLCLNHVVPLLPHLTNQTKDVHLLILLDALKERVQGYERASATHTSTGEGGGHSEN